MQKHTEEYKHTNCYKQFEKQNKESNIEKHKKNLKKTEKRVNQMQWR